MTLLADPDVLTSAVGRIRGIAEELTTARDDVHHQVTGLLEGGWRGRAASSYADAWGDWRAGADDVLAALAYLAELVAGARNDLVAMDESVAGASVHLLARLHERLG